MNHIRRSFASHPHDPVLLLFADRHPAARDRCAERIFYDQPIVLNERQAGAAIEGVASQSADRGIAQLAVDTHGYTDFAVGLARAMPSPVTPS